MKCLGRRPIPTDEPPPLAGWRHDLAVGRCAMVDRPQEMIIAVSSGVPRCFRSELRPVFAICKGFGPIFGLDQTSITSAGTMRSITFARAASHLRPTQGCHRQALIPLTDDRGRERRMPLAPNGKASRPVQPSVVATPLPTPFPVYCRRLGS